MTGNTLPIQRNWVTTKNRDAVLARILEHAALGDTSMAYLGSIEVPQAVWSIAEHVGHIRNISNEELRSHGKLGEFHRGDKQTRYAVVGSVGDVLLSNLYYKHPDVLRAALADVGPSKDLDLVHVPSGLELDVKTTTGQAFNINKQSHHSKPASAYLLVSLPRDDVADLFVSCYEAVHETWRLAKSPHNPSQYYTAKLPRTLEPLPPAPDALVEVEA